MRTWPHLRASCARLQQSSECGQWQAKEHEPPAVCASQQRACLAQKQRCLVHVRVLAPVFRGDQKHGCRSTHSLPAGQLRTTTPCALGHGGHSRLFLRLREHGRQERQRRHNLAPGDGSGCSCRLRGCRLPHTGLPCCDERQRTGALHGLQRVRVAQCAAHAGIGAPMRCMCEPLGLAQTFHLFSAPESPVQENTTMAASTAAASLMPEVDWGHAEDNPEGPFDYRLQCCGAPNPPGALGTTECCGAQTQFYRQRWYCTWKQVAIDCSSHTEEDEHESPEWNRFQKNCGYQKVWRCAFEEIPRCEVLKNFCDRCPPACPNPKGQECECWVPGDQFFAKIYEIEYKECPDFPPDYPTPPNCNLPVDADGNLLRDPQGCACCGVYQVCKARIVRIRCKAEIPADFPYDQAPLQYYRPPAHKPRVGHHCQTATCRAKSTRSPDLAYTLPFS